MNQISETAYEVSLSGLEQKMAVIKKFDTLTLKRWNEIEWIPFPLIRGFKFEL